MFKNSFVLIIVAIFLISAIVGAQSLGSRPERYADDDAPKVGEMAPTFTLKSLYNSDKDSVNIADLIGDKPLVIMFGSYT